jgi:hypothetical protein
MFASAGLAAVILVGGLVAHRVRPGLLAMGLLLGNVAAMGQSVDPVALLGVFGASQVAGIIPGVHGASPREGALVVGLASLGVTWPAALGAVALAALVAWAPALLLGGASFVAGRLRRTADPVPA